MADAETSSNISQEGAQLILGFMFTRFYGSQIPIEQFPTTKAPELWKTEIFERLIDNTESEGFSRYTVYFRP